MPKLTLECFVMVLKLVLLTLVTHVISACLAKTIASQKARSSQKWFLAGLLFGPLGLIASAGLTDRHQIVYLRYLAENQGYQPRHGCGGQTEED